jgi:hypothetical protein
MKSHRPVDSIILLSIAGLIVWACFCAGCAGSGPNGAWTAEDFATVNKGVNDAVGTYERVRYPDRYYPVYPTGP